jgi:oligopeptidase B
MLLTALLLMSIDLEPPVAPKVPKELIIHGDKRVDDYYWMRDKSNPAAIKYLEDENAYTAAVMKPVEPLETRIYDEIIGRIKQTDLSVPVKDGQYYYYSRTVEGQQYPIWCRKKHSLQAPEEILLDGNELAKGHSYFALGGLDHSDDHNLLLYSVDYNGSERFTIQVKDLTTGKLLPESIPETSFGLNWAGDSKTFFYTTFDATHRPEKVHRHVLGTSTDQDAVVFTEPDTQFEFSVGRTRSKRYLLIESVNASKTSEVLYLDAFHPEQPFRIVEPRQSGVEYYVDHQGDHFLIRTNDGGATNFKLMTAPLADPAKKHWKPLIGERPDATLDGTDSFENFLVLYTREKGLPRIEVRNLRTEEAYYIDFPEPAYNVHPEGNAEYKTNTLRFNYTSLVTPPSVFDYDMAAKTRELKKQTEVLGGYDPARYQSERIYATASDGKQIPISLVHKKGLVRSGENRLLLYGYGSYGINSDPGFSPAILSLVDRGFIYAIAHVRGGAEYGRQWFEDGRMLHKKNSFTDFIACGDYLVSERYTSPAKMAAMGGSAGGLLMGAVLNMRPDLFHTVVARVPFVDVVTTMLDASIPLTTGEYDQWGNPNEKVYYDYMKSYSPYDNVEAKAYPNILITTGLNDPRVAYWEPAKWTAKLRALKTDHNTLLLKTNMGAGHGGASGRYERFKDTAFIYAFILNTMGIQD